jgi:hypothetical protein
MQDASGWIAMACTEVLIHTYDACRGLGTPFEPPSRIAERILARTYPWVELDAEPWQVLLWVSGRIELNGKPRTPDGLPGVREPLALWDGTPPQPRRPDVVEWVLDDDSWPHLQDLRSVRPYSTPRFRPPGIAPRVRWATRVTTYVSTS